MLFAKTHDYPFALIICYFHYKSATDFIKFPARREELGHARPATGGLWQAL